MNKVSITQPGVYDIPENEYHDDPCPEPSGSSSVLKVINKETPLQAFLSHPRMNEFYESKKKKEYNIGSASHEMLLGKGAGYVELKFNDYKTKAARDERDAVYSLGRVPLLSKQIKETTDMVKSARHQLKMHEEGHLLLKEGYSEQVLVWKEDGNWHRAMLDRITLKRDYIFDYKTTGISAHPNQFLRQIVNLGYDFSMAHYLKGEEILHAHEPQYRWIVQENFEPYVLSVIAPTPKMIEVGRAKRSKALTAWNWCMKNDKWPGFPQRTIYVDPPVYDAQKWLDEEGDLLTSTDDEMKAVREAWSNWQEPTPLNETKE